MIKVQFYTNLYDEEPFITIEVNTVTFGYVRKGKNTIEDNLYANLILTVEDVTSLLVDYNYPFLFNKHTFEKVEFTTKNGTETIDNITLLCNEIITKLNATGVAYTTYNFKEIVN